MGSSPTTGTKNSSTPLGVLLFLLSEGARTRGRLETCRGHVSTRVGLRRSEGRVLPLGTEIVQQRRCLVGGHGVTHILAAAKKSAAMEIEQGGTVGFRIFIRMQQLQALFGQNRNAGSCLKKRLEKRARKIGIPALHASSRPLFLFSSTKFRMKSTTRHILFVNNL